MLQNHQLDQITDFEIANSECFATGWGVTQGTLDDISFENLNWSASSERDHSDVAQYMPVKLSPNTDGAKGTLIGQAVSDAMNICDVRMFHDFSSSWFMKHWKDPSGK